MVLLKVCRIFCATNCQPNTP